MYFNWTYLRAEWGCGIYYHLIADGNTYLVDSPRPLRNSACSIIDMSSLNFRFVESLQIISQKSVKCLIWYYIIQESHNHGPCCLCMASMYDMRWGLRSLHQAFCWWLFCDWWSQNNHQQKAWYRLRFRLLDTGLLPSTPLENSLQW